VSTRKMRPGSFEPAQTVLQSFQPFFRHAM
jgi:hypothetical protein